MSRNQNILGLLALLCLTGLLIQRDLVRRVVVHGICTCPVVQDWNVNLQRGHISLENVSRPRIEPNHEHCELCTSNVITKTLT